MTTFEQLTAALAEELKNAPAFAGCRVGAEFPAREILPLDAPEIQIGVQKAAMSSCDPGDLLGCGGDGATLSGRALTITVAYTLYAGPDQGGGRLQELAGELLSFLAFDSGFAFSSVECSELSDDPDTGGVKLTAAAVLKAVLKNQGTGGES